MDLAGCPVVHSPFVVLRGSWGLSSALLTFYYIPLRNELLLTQNITGLHQLVVLAPIYKDGRGPRISLVCSPFFSWTLSWLTP